MEEDEGSVEQSEQRRLLLSDADGVAGLPHTAATVAVKVSTQRRRSSSVHHGSVKARTSHPCLCFRRAFLGCCLLVVVVVVVFVLFFVFTSHGRRRKSGTRRCWGWFRRSTGACVPAARSCC